MEPEEYIEYVEDTILSRTPELGQKGCYAKVSRRAVGSNDLALRAVSEAKPRSRSAGVHIIDIHINI